MQRRNVHFRPRLVRECTEFADAVVEVSFRNRGGLVLNPDPRRDHLQRLAVAGVDPTAAEQRGQLEVQINTEAYIRDGRFDRDRMLAAFEQMASGNAGGAFPLSAFAAEWIMQLQIDATWTISSNLNRV
jgi:hypothetical protein